MSASCRVAHDNCIRAQDAQMRFWDLSAEDSQPPAAALYHALAGRVSLSRRLPPP
jgi:hypothetical protein